MEIPSLHAKINDAVSKLNPRQREAVDCAAGPTLIIAGAGTGKTKTLTCKIAKLIAGGTPASRILAVTFTNKAAGEMRERVEALVPGQGSRVWIYTFHSFCVRLLRQHARAQHVPQDFVIYDDSDQKKIIQMVLSEMGKEDEKNRAGLYLNLISRAKDDLLDAESYSIHAQTNYNNPHRLPVAEVYTRYQAKLAQAGALDFGDLLLKTADLLSNNTQVREYYQDFFHQILVDEYQDTNRAQYIITKLLSAKRRNLCVVGDPDQSIYSWRGADIRNILEFERDFPDAQVIALEQNYRSTANILKAADNLIRYNLKRKQKTLFTTKEHGEPVRVEELPSEGEEARWVASKINSLIDDGYSLNDVAVFYRTNAQSRSFEDYFRRAQIPYRLIGATRFYDRAEVKDAMSYARLLVNPYDTVSLLRILNVPARCISKITQGRMERYSAEKGLTIFDTLKAAPEIPDMTTGAIRGATDLANLIETIRLEASNGAAPAYVLQRILLMSGYWKSIEDGMDKNPDDTKARLGNLQELINAVKEYEERNKDAENPPTLSGWLQEVSLMSGSDDVSGGDSAVTLMTIHLAKGLEFPVVFLTGLEEGLFPIGAGQSTDDELEEERRLCYVGMTRAKEILFLTYAATRRIFGKVYSNLASRFLFESHLMTRQEEVPAKEQVDFVAPAAPKILPTAGTMSGRRVRHAVYGNGKIVSESGSGDNKKITVLFDQGGRQTFMVRYAPLEIL